jgi:hypothetical protein
MDGIDVGGQLEPALAAEALARPRRGAVAMCLCAERAVTIPHGCSSLCTVRLKRVFLGGSLQIPAKGLHETDPDSKN